MKTKFKIIRKLLNIKKNPVHTDKTILKYDTELGIYSAYANDLGKPEVILTTALTCAADVIFTTADGKNICIVHAADSVSIF